MELQELQDSQIQTYLPFISDVVTMLHLKFICSSHFLLSLHQDFMNSYLYVKTFSCFKVLPSLFKSVLIVPFTLNPFMVQ